MQQWGDILNGSSVEAGNTAARVGLKTISHHLKLHKNLQADIFATIWLSRMMGMRGRPACRVFECRQPLTMGSLDFKYIIPDFARIICTTRYDKGYILHFNHAQRSYFTSVSHTALYDRNRRVLNVQCIQSWVKILSLTNKTFRLICIFWNPFWFAQFTNEHRRLPREGKKMLYLLMRNCCHLIISIRSYHYKTFSWNSRWYLIDIERLFYGLTHQTEWMSLRYILYRVSIQTNC